jgi:hypothetical protein
MVPRSAEMAPAVSTTISVMLPSTPQRSRWLTSSDAGPAQGLAEQVAAGVGQPITTLRVNQQNGTGPAGVSGCAGNVPAISC